MRGEIRALKRQIEQARAAAQAEVDHIRARQAMAVWQISDTGRTIGQIVELLELPEKEARRLVRVGRPTTNTDAAAGCDRNAVLPVRKDPSPTHRGQRPQAHVTARRVPDRTDPTSV